MSQRKGLEKTLQERGYRLTTARHVIWETLVMSGGHVSADELVELVRERAPRVGRMTVYRTLDLLGDIGFIRPIYQGTGAAHYIIMEDGHHHHLICSNCDRVIEIEDCLLNEVEQRLGERFGFRMEGHLLEFYGRCPECH